MAVAVTSMGAARATPELDDRKLDAQLIGWCSAFNAGRARIEAAYRAAPDNDWNGADAVADRIEGS